MNSENRPESGPRDLGSVGERIARRPDTPLTPDRLIAIEPRLAAVLDEARALPSPEWGDYGRLKRKVSGLVGWRVEDSTLGTSAAYDLAVAALVGALRL